MSRAAGLLLGMGLAVLAGAPAGAKAPPVKEEARAVIAWPAPGAPLTVASVAFPKGFGTRRIYLDAGHGAVGNTGNQSVTCEDEEAFTLRVAEDLRRRLEATGHFQVRLSRKAGERVPYPSRLNAAEKWRAHAFMSLHSDARGMAARWSPEPGRECDRMDSAPGFSVLWSEEATSPLFEQRAALARAIALHMGQAGFRPYDGADYVGLYTTDAAQAGVFAARPPDNRNIFVLRRPRIPSIIIETHHALDFEEAARWREERTLEAFAAAVARGLVDALGPAAVPAVSPSAGGSAQAQE